VIVAKAGVDRQCSCKARAVETGSERKGKPGVQSSRRRWSFCFTVLRLCCLWMGATTGLLRTAWKLEVTLLVRTRLRCDG